MPWTDDKLGRDKYGYMLDSVIKNSKLFRRVSEESLVIAINSNYGSGKSTFLDMWSEHLIGELDSPRKSLVIKLNAWSTDDYENALIPFVHGINKGIDTIDNKEIRIRLEDRLIEDFRKASLNSILRFGRKMVDYSLEKNLGFNSEDVKAEIDKFKSDFTNNGLPAFNSILSEYDEYLSSKEQFKNSLKEIASEIPIIILIDELDRCRPTYAIETLEVIKHYFDVENVTYVFATDIEQLSHSIGTIYGQNMDSQGYLRKFFDVIVTLPKPSINDYIEMKYSNLSNEIFGNISANYSPIISNVASEFSLSLREIDSLMPSIHLLLINLKEKIGMISRNLEFYQKFISIFFYFFFLKHKKQNVYDLLLNETFGLDDIRIPKTQQVGVITMIKLLSNGKNQSFMSLKEFNSDDFINYLSNTIEIISFRMEPQQSSLGNFIHNFIESSFIIVSKLE